MGRHATTFEKECLCFRCPLEDCRTPCPFGMDKRDIVEDISDEFFYGYIEREKQEKDKKKEEKRAYNREYYLKNKERLKSYYQNYYNEKNKKQLF